MLTLLDTAYTLFLNRIQYQNNLKIELIEGFVGKEPQTVQISSDLYLGDTYPIDISDKSRGFCISFEHPVAWQVVDESFCSFNKEEDGEHSGFLRIMQSTMYFEYVKKQHGWFEDVIGPAKQYRICSENEIIDVISCDAPEIMELESNI